MPAILQIAPVGSIALTAGSDLDPYRIRWEHHRRLGAKDTWSLTAVGDLGPIFAIPGALALPSGHGGQLHHHRYDTSRVVTYSPTMLGMGGVARTLLANSPEYDGTYLTWGGECCRALLEKEYQDMPDILPDSKGTPGPMASVTAQAIGAKYGVPVQWNAPDYRLNVLRRSGVPWEWMEKILRVFQLKANFAGKTLVISKPKLSGRGKRVFRDHVNIVAGSMRFQEIWGERKNQFRTARLDTAGGVIGTKSDRGGHIIGDQNSLDFDFPTYSAFLQVDTGKTNVDLILFIFKDEDGETINTSGTDGNYVGAKPAKSVHWTCKPKTEATSFGPPAVGVQQGGAAYTAEYSIVFTGGGRTSSDKPIPYVKGPGASSTLFRTRPEKTIVTYQEIADNSAAEQACQALLDENERQVYACSFRSWMDPALDVGDRVDVYHDKTAQAGVNWLVEEKREVIDGGYWMDLVCTKGSA